VLSKFFAALYLKVLVNIVVKHSSTLIYIEMHSKKGAVESLHKEFNTTTPNENMLEFINTYIKQSPYYYISILDISAGQGVIPTCAKNRLAYYCDLSNSEYKCYDGKWTYYTPKTELYAMEKAYKKIGIDFIFSPFVVLANFFKDKITKKLALYAIIEDSFISIAVFENSALLYGEHLDMQTNSEMEDILLSNDEIEEELNLDETEGIDLDNIDVEESEESLDDFGDIEDLDSLEDIDEFSEDKDVEEELLESEDVLEESEEADFNEDYQRFSLIQTSIANFYKDEKYESQFIENMYIADCVGVNSELKKYLEEEMFLNVYIRHAEMDGEICDLVKMELEL